MLYIAGFVLLAIDISPVQIKLKIVCVVALLIDRALPVALLPTIRQQLVEAKHVPLILACSSAAS